jgi:hypothetical protein
MRRNKLNFLFLFLCNLSVLQDFFNRLWLLTFSSFICACHCHRQQNTSYYLTMKKAARNVFQSTYLSFYSYSWRICKDNLKYYYFIFSFCITFFIDSICSNYWTPKKIYESLQWFFFRFSWFLYFFRHWHLLLPRLLHRSASFVVWNLQLHLQSGNKHLTNVIW